MVFPVFWSEPWGLVPLEAMAAGRPVIATGRGGSCEYLVDGVNALLYPADDPVQLAERVRRLADDGPLRAALRQAGFSAAIERTAERFNREVESILDPSGGPGGRRDPRSARRKHAPTRPVLCSRAWPRGSRSTGRRTFCRASGWRSRRATSPAVTRSAVRLARDASPRLFYFSAAGQILVAILLGAQVLMGKLALEAIFDAERTDGSVSDALAPLVGLVAAGAVGSFIGAFQTQAQRVLGQQVRRSTLDSTLAVTTAVDLETFESPEFFDDLQRVQTNALLQPLTMSHGPDHDARRRARRGRPDRRALRRSSRCWCRCCFASALPLWLVSRATGKLEFDFNYDQTPGRAAALLPRRDAHRARGGEGAARLRARRRSCAGAGTRATSTTWPTCASTCAAG